MAGSADEGRRHSAGHRIAWDRLHEQATQCERHSVNGIDHHVLGDREYLDNGDPGVSVVVHGGSSFGLPGALDLLLSRHRIGHCVLLRFHGHGGPGSMVVTGDGVHGSGFHPHRSEGYRQELSRLRRLFGPLGSIELHGCRVGSGGPGARSLEILVEETGVPVSAAYSAQYGGAASDRFEGPVRTVFPHALSLRSWAEAQLGHQCAARV